MGSMATETVKGLALAFCTALGVILGGAIIGSLSGLIAAESPYYRMQRLAGDMKLWAVVVALGGSWPTLRAMDSGLFQGDIPTLLRQIGLMVSGLSGAQIGYWIIVTLTGGPAR